MVILITPSVGHEADLSVNLLQSNMSNMRKAHTTDNCRVTAILLDGYESFDLAAWVPAQLKSKGSEDQISPTL